MCHPTSERQRQPDDEDPEQRKEETTDFLKNATLFGTALVFVALAGTVWPYALNVGL